MILYRFAKQINRDTTLVAAEVFVQDVPELFSCRQLASMDDQIALQQADKIFAHVLGDLLRRLFLLSVFSNAR